MQVPLHNDFVVFHFNNHSSMKYVVSAEALFSVKICVMNQAISVRGSVGVCACVCFFLSPPSLSLTVQNCC